MKKFLRSIDWQFVVEWTFIVTGNILLWWFLVLFFLKYTVVQW